MKKTNRIFEIVASYSKCENMTEINENTSLINDLLYGSLTIFELIVELETEFDIEFPDEYLDYEVIDKVGNIVKIISELVESNE